MNGVIRKTLLVVAAVVGAFVAFRLLSVLMLWPLYSWYFQMVRGASGLPDAVSGAVSIWLVAVTLLLLPTFFSAVFFKRDPRKVFILAGAASALMVLVYLVSLPKDGQYFNPITGEAMYRYARTAGGEVELFPLGYSFHPVDGSELALVTPEVAREFAEQEAERRSAVGTTKIEEEAQEVPPTSQVDGQVVMHMITADNPARIVVPPGHRWDIVGNPPAFGWTTDFGTRDERGNRIQVFELVPPAKEVKLPIRVRRCTSPQDCAW